MVWRAPNGVKIGGPSWSPDGKQLAFMASTGDLMTVDLESGRTRVVISGQSFSDVTYSPDGTKLAWIAALSPSVSRSCVVTNCRWYAANSRVATMDFQTGQVLNGTKGWNLHKVIWRSGYPLAVIALGASASLDDQATAPALSSFDTRSTTALYVNFDNTALTDGTELFQVIGGAVFPTDPSAVLLEPGTRISSLSWGPVSTGPRPGSATTALTLPTAGGSWNSAFQPATWANATGLASSSNGRNYVAIDRTTNSALYASRLDNGLFGALTPLTGPNGAPFPVIQVSVDSTVTNGFVQVFAVSTDHRVWHRALTTATNVWTEWAPLDGAVTAKYASLTVNAFGQAEVVAVTTFTTWYRLRFTDGSWTAWQPAPSGALRVAASSATIDFFTYVAYMGSNVITVQRRNDWTGAWDTVAFMHTPDQPTEISILAAPRGRVDLVYRDRQDRVWHQASTDGTWSENNFKPIVMPPVTPGIALSYETAGGGNPFASGPTPSVPFAVRLVAGNLN